MTHDQGWSEFLFIACYQPFRDDSVSDVLYVSNSKLFLIWLHF